MPTIHWSASGTLSEAWAIVVYLRSSLTRTRNGLATDISLVRKRDGVWHWVGTPVFGCDGFLNHRRCIPTWISSPRGAKNERLFGRDKPNHFIISVRVGRTF